METWLTCLHNSGTSAIVVSNMESCVGGLEGDCSPPVRAVREGVILIPCRAGLEAGGHD